MPSGQPTSSSYNSSSKASTTSAPDLGSEAALIQECGGHQIKKMKKRKLPTTSRTNWLFHLCVFSADKQSGYFICVIALLINKVYPQVTVEAVIGSSVVLPCSSAKRDQDTEVHWRHNNSKIVYDIIKGEYSVALQDQQYKNRVETFPDEYERGNFSIKLNNLQHADAGEFSCFIKPSDKQETIKLIPTDAASSVFAVLINKGCLQVTVEAVIGGSVVLPCSSTESHLKLQNSNVHWRHNDSKIVYDIVKGDVSIAFQDSQYKNRTETFPHEYVRRNFSIKLNNLQRTDAGTYICYITNSSDFKGQIVHLHIKGHHDHQNQHQKQDTNPVIKKTKQYIQEQTIYGNQDLCSCFAL
ncbi:V-set domain-containing T-cell activation inhibitor 1-like protein [Labeo rohita]|uniref:V-set domain-containing T-cell activation inhibitor 1-like protein n=1 Tax=Labeo rohita TaxID=84645 RepID=A0A498LHW7_LABRO|nr:V-set domain-containing T-cell activation inhibitor 1-like protein [Labeo rohita]